MLLMAKLCVVVMTDYMLRLAVLQVLNVKYNAASLPAWMFYSTMSIQKLHGCSSIQASELASQLGQ